MAKFYAVQKGFGGPAVYGTWNECKEHVDGYSGAVYKSFPTEDEARAFAFGDSGRKKQPSIPVDIVAYTDGSFDSSDKWNPKSGFAAILLRGTLETATWLGCMHPLPSSLGKAARCFPKSLQAISGEEETGRNTLATFELL